MESQLSRIKVLGDERVTENLRRGQNELVARSPDHMENGQPVVTQLNLEDILLNNNNVSPRQVGQILRALGDELDNAFKFPPRISKSG